MIKIISKCPSCSATLERINDQLFCSNINCGEKRIKQVTNFANKMKIKGLGQKSVEKLNLLSIEDIYNLSTETVKSVLGEKITKKLLDEIDKSKNTDLSVFLSACSIPLIGLTAGKKVAKVTTNPLNINKELCKRAGLGDKATINLVNWINNEYIGKLEYLPITFKEVIEIKATLKVCISGKISGYTKNSLTTELASKGVQVVGTVTKNLDYLICEQRGSSKETKAINYGIPVVTLNELLQEI